MPAAILNLFLFAQQAATEAATAANETATTDAGSILDRLKGVFSNASAWSAAPNARLMLATVIGGLGLWLMLPSLRKSNKIIGAFLAAIAAILMLSLLPVMPVDFNVAMFWVLAAVTLSAGVATITSRSPVYCAIWFAVVLLGTGGLFLINGAQFLGIATVAVYAGAIVVTFLFVLMLAQPEGHSFYDRISWGKIPSLMACIAGVGFASLIIGAVAATPLAELATAAPQNTNQDVLAADHVAALGGQLFTKHLINVQLAATLLMVALVGAVAMAAHGSNKQQSAGMESNDIRQSIGNEDGDATQTSELPREEAVV